ncbi:Insect cuticle protein [Popillia japonica]|uniref:Insect cuticle protein n=1 Tax=Popillia japonica TaxID=7064 RepID=A0AAW1LZ37_POPJA
MFLINLPNYNSSKFEHTPNTTSNTAYKTTKPVDNHAQHEERDGDKVKGYYTLKEADGTIRTVHYEADKHNGFNAHVERSGHANHPANYGHGGDGGGHGGGGGGGGGGHGGH